MKIGNIKSFYFIITIIIMSFLFVYSCKKTAPTEPQNPSPSSNGGSTSLGTISYTLDNSKEKSATLDTTAINISTTDASGIKWDLYIPKQDFQNSTTITITPIKNVKSDTSTNITNGVIFQPDGFQFSSPATLTVTIPTSSKKYVFYLFTQDGKELDFAPFTASGGVYKISVAHFSGIASGVASNPGELCARGTVEYNDALNEENKIINQNPVVPVPPDIDLDCGMNSSKEKILDDYIKEFMLPEDTVIKKMLGGLSAMESAGCNENVTAGGLAQADKLGEHLVKKAQMAYNQYSNDNKKYPAVVKAMLTADARLQLLGGTSPTNEFVQLGDWAKRYYNSQLNKLKQEHDYKVIKSLYTIAAQAELFGDQLFFINDIQNALSFEFQLSEELNLVYSDGTQGDHIFINGSININPYFGNTGYSNLYGTGSINYTSGYMPDDCEDPNGSPQPTHDELVLPQSFPLLVEIDSLDLCTQNFIVVYFDSLGSPDEQWNYGVGLTGAHACDSKSFPPTHTLDDNFLAFANTKYYNFDSDSFKFHPAVQNGNATVFDKTYNETVKYQGDLLSYSLTAKLELKLVHTPK